MNNHLSSIVCVMIFTVLATAHTAVAQTMETKGFIRVAPDQFTFQDAQGNRFLPMGAYYLDDRHTEIDPLRWWDHFNEDHIRQDFRIARDLGCNTLRISFYLTVDRDTTPPTVGTPEDFAKCDTLLAIARENNLRLYIEPRIDRSWPQMSHDLPLWIEAFHKLCGRYRDDPTVFCWQLDAEAITLVGYTGDREAWGQWMINRHGSEEAAAQAWGIDPEEIGWIDRVWDEMTGLLQHAPGHDERRDRETDLWYLDDQNKPGDARLYDWQLFREHLYTSRIQPIAEVARRDAPNHLLAMDLIIWAFPFYRNPTAAGWGGPYGYAGIDLEAIGKMVDFVGLHTYPMYIPPFTSEWYEGLMRDEQVFNNQLRYLETACRYVRAATGKPVVHTETGWHGGVNDYQGNTEDDQKRWNLALIEATKDCAIGWINWTLKDVPTHEGVTGWGGMVTTGIRVKPDPDDLNPLSNALFDGVLPDAEAHRVKAWGAAFKEVVASMHADPELRFIPGTHLEVSRRQTLTADVRWLEGQLRSFMSDDRFPCDVELIDP